MESCGKVAYTSQSKAKNAVTFLRNVRNQSMREYFHSDCRMWHLTSNKINFRKEKPSKRYGHRTQYF